MKKECQHEKLQFRDGSFRIYCENCDAIWIGLKYGGGFDTSLNRPMDLLNRTISVGMNLELVKNVPKYWEFIRQLRSDPRNQSGFVEQVEITSEQQKKYMEKHNDEYYVAISNTDGPVGFIGVVDNDIRLAVKPEFHGKGVGKFMVSQLNNVLDLTDAFAKVKHDNIGSQKVFLGCGYTQIRENDNFKYYILE